MTHTLIHCSVFKRSLTNASRKWEKNDLVTQRTKKTAKLVAQNVQNFTYFSEVAELRYPIPYDSHIKSLLCTQEKPDKCVV